MTDSSVPAMLVIASVLWRRATLRRALAMGTATTRKASVLVAIGLKASNWVRKAWTTISAPPRAAMSLKGAAFLAVKRRASSIVAAGTTRSRTASRPTPLGPPRASMKWSSHRIASRPPSRRGPKVSRWRRLGLMRIVGGLRRTGAWAYVTGRPPPGRTAMTRTTLARHLILPALALAALSVVGCGAQPGDTLVQYEKGDTGDIMVPVPGTGRAALYSVNDASPDLRVPVSRGDEVGFRDRRPEGGAVEAVVNDRRIKTLDQGTVFDRDYLWKFQEK